MCHIKRKTYVDQAGHRQVDKIRYVCDFYKQGLACSTTSEDEGEIHTREMRPATSTGHPTRDQAAIADEPSAISSQHNSGKSRMPIGTLFLESIGARPKTKKVKSHSKRQKERMEVVIDQHEIPPRPPGPSFYETRPFEDPRQPPPPPTHHPPTSTAMPARPAHVEIVDSPRPRRRRETVIHDRRTVHTPPSPAEPSRLERLYRASDEYVRPRHDSVHPTPTTASPDSPIYSAADDNEHTERILAREMARKRQSDEIRRRNEEDRRQEREAEDRRQARIERERYRAREEQRRRSREEAQERLRREEELKEEQRRREKADREHREHQRRVEERLRRVQRGREDIRQRYRYHERELPRHTEPFPDYYEPPRAPPQAPPRRAHADVPYGDRPSMRYGNPPSPRIAPRATYYPAGGYDERHGTYYGETRPSARIEQHTSSWWPTGAGLFRRNTYSGGRPACRESERSARRRALFWDH